MRLFWNVFRAGLPWAVGLGALIALYPQPARPASALTATTTMRPPATGRATVPTRAPRQVVTPVTAPQTPGSRVTAPRNTPAPGPRVTLSRCDRLELAWQKIAGTNDGRMSHAPYTITAEQDAQEQTAYDLWVTC